MTQLHWQVVTPLMREELGATVVRSMAYFQRAEQEQTPDMLQPVGWDTVKAFFRDQAVVLARQWLV